MAITRGLKDLGLKWKILIPAAAIVAAAVLVASVLGAAHIRHILVEQLTLRGESLTLALATQLESQKASDTGTLSLMVTQYQSGKGVAYVFLTDPKLKIEVHTFAGDPPAGIELKNQVEADATVVKTEEMTVEGEAVLDFAFPVTEGVPGAVHLGMELGEIREQIGQLITETLLWMALVCGVGFVLLWALMTWVVGSLNGLAEAVRRIADEGDLSHFEPADSDDEVGRLGRSFQSMVVALREIPEGVSLSVQGLAASVAQLEEVLKRQEQAVQLQASSLYETQVTATEIKTVSEVAAGKTAEVLASARQAEGISAAGQAAVLSTLDGLRDSQQKVLEIGAKIAELDKQMIQVLGITDTVKDLADQSNILALNAAIEAVRSGEHGKGFGLVATEIRRLADQSLQATGKVNEILLATSKALEEAVAHTNAGVGKLEKDVLSVRSSGEHLKAMASMSAANVAAAGQIAASVEQQNQGIKQIFTAVVDQNALMEQTEAGLREARATLEGLRQASGQLTAIVQRYGVKSQEGN